MIPTPSNNIAYKRIRWALSLTDTDVIEIIRLGGMEASKSMADSWNRSAHATKSGSGNSSARTLSRFREMSDEYLQAFCIGLTKFNKLPG